MSQSSVTYVELNSTKVPTYVPYRAYLHVDLPLLYMSALNQSNSFILRNLTDRDGLA